MAYPVQLVQYTILIMCLKSVVEVTEDVFKENDSKGLVCVTLTYCNLRFIFASTWIQLAIYFMFWPVYAGRACVLTHLDFKQR